MFVDASALVALLLGEPDAHDLARRLDAAGGAVTSPLALFETIAAVMTRRRIGRAEVEQEVERLLHESSITVAPITPEIGGFALEAFERYGKGRGHPAQLNMGDCFAYACARAHRLPLLYKGDDFVHTDLA
ncbi:type II toxin-antitoxin system VapC family toxin [Ancylobacter sp. 6x-1]|uniref:Ribonuclease VapC n=1 Tax=Ancylobacter crimeensis TaxID=2579147 RepID=A0ABT0D887_9HYPH|nr:type II toxin-antitoxin system VapC family toxin [Ancylobacter crimeensis]MCK0196151.1 type II toxin-antitoxin system VapC family toxin [Ancylobacter crimeensis]